jgi:hypothetical protein
MLTPKGEAHIVTTDGQTVTLQAPFPSPPGSPLQGTLKDSAHRLQVKVHGCRALDPSAAVKCFEITGRWVSLTKEAREQLTQG